MSKTNSFETSLLELLFNNTTLAAIGDATGLIGSTADGNFYVSLHTADPTETGGIAAECDYTGYARVAVVRTAAGWTIAAGVASNAAAITFAACTAGANTVTHFGICKADVEGVADLIGSGALTASLAVSSGITPEVAIGDCTWTED